MSRIIVEYNPPISFLAQRKIREEVTESMRSNDETSCQYDISMVIECLEHNEMTDDLKLVYQWLDEGVHYLDF